MADPITIGMSRACVNGEMSFARACNDGPFSGTGEIIPPLPLPGEAPSAPLLSGSGACTDQLTTPPTDAATLAWTDSTGDAPILYTLQRNVNGAGWGYLVVDTEDTDYIDSTLPDGSSVLYRVVATNGVGSATSNELSITSTCPSPSLSDYVPGRIILLMDMPMVIGSMVTVPPESVDYQGISGTEIVKLSNAGSPRALYTSNSADFATEAVQADTAAQRSAHWSIGGIALDMTFQPRTLGFTVIDIQLAGYKAYSPTQNQQDTDRAGLSLLCQNAPLAFYPSGTFGPAFISIGCDHFGATSLYHVLKFHYLGAEDLLSTHDRPETVWLDNNTAPAGGTSKESLSAFVYRKAAGIGVVSVDLLAVNESARTLYLAKPAENCTTVAGSPPAETTLAAYVGVESFDPYVDGMRNGPAHPVLLIMEGVMTNAEILAFCNAVFDGVTL